MCREMSSSEIISRDVFCEQKTEALIVDVDQSFPTLVECWEGGLGH